jgi:acyl-coenzyme A synthetase/AMP-(fatty) acid ligase
MPLLLERLESGGVERLFLPCVALQMLAEHGVRLGSYPSRLREVITAGEQLICSPAIRGWFAGLSGASLFNHYGPTETHVVTGLCLDGDPDRWPHRPAIGHPVANSVLRVVDSSGKSALPGAVGELLIGGLMAERCYLNAPQLNAHRFVESPDLFYRSGDLVSVDGDGVIEYVGRQDRQVKTSGYRLELEQVEAALMEHRGIAQAVVMQEDNQLVIRGRQRDDGDGRIFIHRGIASRQFQRAFVLAEGIDVEGAWLDNGLLHLDLKRPMPEVRVKSIPITTRGTGMARPVVNSRMMRDDE